MVGVKVIVDVTVDVIEGMGVIVETAITVFPILQLTRMNKHHKMRKNFFAMMITSVTISLPFLCLNARAPNGLRYLRVGGRGQCLGAGKIRSQKNA
jgi:hypothetical protein